MSVNGPHSDPQIPRAEQERTRWLQEVMVKADLICGPGSPRTKYPPGDLFHSLRSKRDSRVTLPWGSVHPCPWAGLGFWPDAPRGPEEPLGSWGAPCGQESWGLAGLLQSLIIVTVRVSVSILPAFGQKKGKRRERREWRERAEGRL